MLQRKQLITGLMLVLTLTVALSVAAEDKAKVDIKDGKSHLTVDKDGDIIRIVNFGDGDEQILELDLSGMEALVSEALVDMGDILSDLDDMQMTVKLGDDNRLSVAHDESYWELDLDEIMTQVGVALESASLEFDMDDWTHNSRQHHFSVSDDDLEDELEALRDEVRALRKELKDIREK